MLSGPKNRAEATAEPKPVPMVFVHPGPGAQEVPGFGVFKPGETREFADQATADAAYETGWFAPPGGKSKRQLAEADKEATA